MNCAMCGTWMVLEPVFGLVQVWSISGVYPPKHVGGTRRCFKPFASPVQCFGVQAFVDEPVKVFQGGPDREIRQRSLAPE